MQSSCHTYCRRHADDDDDDQIGLYPVGPHNRDLIMRLLPHLTLSADPGASQNAIYKGDAIVGYMAHKIEHRQLQILALHTVDTERGYDLVAIEHAIDIALASGNIAEISIGDRDGEHVDNYVQNIVISQHRPFCDKNTLHGDQH